MTIYGDCWRQRWIAIINFFCLFLSFSGTQKLVLLENSVIWKWEILEYKNYYGEID